MTTIYLSDLLRTTIPSIRSAVGISGKISAGNFLMVSRDGYVLSAESGTLTISIHECGSARTSMYTYKHNFFNINENLLKILMLRNGRSEWWWHGQQIFFTKLSKMTGRQMERQLIFLNELITGLVDHIPELHKSDRMWGCSLFCVYLPPSIR